MNPETVLFTLWNVVTEILSLEPLDSTFKVFTCLPIYNPAHSLTLIFAHSRSC